MSKRLGNAVDPFETIEKYGPDATRWYMITNSQPWDNLKFRKYVINEKGEKEFRLKELKRYKGNFSEHCIIRIPSLLFMQTLMVSVMQSLKYQ